ncbi:MAG: alanine racemase [Ignavibacteriae bacterium]|nr:MAG: alanine racemase [Ignavibacteriota bacterium]
MIAGIETYKNRPTRAEISFENLRNNYGIVKSFIKDDVKIMAMVKANAYGHGLYEISSELLNQGVDYLGVAVLEEGVYLRECGITAPILVLGPINTDQIAEFIKNDIEITSSSTDKSAAIAAVAKEMRKKALVHLKVDTGMERIGVHWYHAERFIEKSYDFESMTIKGIFSHLAKSESDPGFTNQQLDRFDAILDSMEKKKLIPELVHMANSAGIMNFPASHYSMVRPGIMLYGYNPNGYRPDQSFEGRSLKPVMTLKSKVSFFKVVPANTGLSYNHTHVTKNQTRIVTLPLGYGDGYTRLLSNKGEVVIRGKKYPVVGTICMDQCMVDIGMEGEAYNGDDVLLFGDMDGCTIPLESLCDKIGTITYELLCGISSRVPRIYRSL